MGSLEISQPYRDSGAALATNGREMGIEELLQMWVTGPFILNFNVYQVFSSHAKENFFHSSQ
jgi:hypothetical protein